MAASLLNLDKENEWFDHSGFLLDHNNPALMNESVLSHLTFHLLHLPVIAPPNKANPRDEAKAAACMAALPLKRRRGDS